MERLSIFLIGFAAVIGRKRNRGETLSYWGKEKQNLCSESQDQAASRLHVKILAEVQLSAFGVIDEEIAVTAGEHFSFMDQVGPIHDRERQQELSLRT